MSLKMRAIGLAVIVVLAAGAWGLYRLGMQRGMNMSSGMTMDMMAAPKAAAADKNVLYWHDPMVPAQHFDKPGKSPFMDMQLEPVYANADDAKGTVSIAPQVQQNLGIRTSAVKWGALTPTLTAVSSVAYNERDVVVLQARAAGFVERLRVRAPLESVHKGQVLAELYVPDWVAAQEEFLALRQMSGADLSVLAQGARQRMRLVGMTDAQIAQVAHTGKVQAHVAITAPVTGVVAELSVREGMTVMTGANLFRLTGLSTVWVNAEVPEASIALVRPGTLVRVTTPAWPGKTFSGRVSAILPDVDMTTRTLKVRVEVANPNMALVPGMFASASFALTAGHEGILVPTEAVIKTGLRSLVFVRRDQGHFEPVSVQTGLESQGQTEILSGLEVGQQVVVSGQFLVDSEASLKGVSERMQAPDTASSMTSMGKTHVGAPPGMMGKMDMRGMSQ